MNIVENKEILRNKIWKKLYEKDLSLRKNGDYGKIPDFKGKTKAAKLLRNTDEWKNAKTIFCSPDSAQIPVRKFALEDNKNLIMASPNLTKGYIFLDGKNIKNTNEAADKENAFKYQTKIKSYPKIDLVIEGSVAVDKKGHRIGKGKGYGDREICDLYEKSLINSKTPIITTIHNLQLVSYIPIEDHDMKINMIVTNDTILKIRTT
ncbi:5-formyltetrahydrofolate cyclo-ligase [Methanobrevibacter wolinii]|uniref:5-formyltetrahydrofolate cyclo-ligase n=1 Tax=Methanobrevibacter wolinii TaxID=190977 RepID=UPI0005B26038|nr:5-formyltetrahydrofolate cyclo-ligase [Methanobrevibacter wolinii]